MRHELNTRIEIEAGPEVVWTVLTSLDEFPEWNPFIIQSSGSVVEGARLTNRLRPPGGKEMTFKPTVTVVEEQQVFEWLGRLAFPGVFDGRHRFELEETGRGTTVLHHSERFTGVLVPLLRRSLDTQTFAGFDAMNAALKERAERLAGTKTVSTDDEISASGGQDHDR